MLHRTLRVPTGPSPPMHRLRLLIEDPTLAAAGLSDEWRGQMEVSICSGPRRTRGMPACPRRPVSIGVGRCRGVRLGRAVGPLRAHGLAGQRRSGWSTLGDTWRSAPLNASGTISSTMSAIISPVTLPSDEES